MRTAPINLRANPQQRALIDLAASLVGKTRSDFMLETAYQRAQDVILDQRLFYFEQAELDWFAHTLEQPIENNIGLQNLLATEAPWDKK
jgi:uncharacterized protein (DUF1778 family)